MSCLSELGKDRAGTRPWICYHSRCYSSQSQSLSPCAQPPFHAPMRARNHAVLPGRARCRGACQRVIRSGHSPFGGRLRHGLHLSSPDPTTATVHISLRLSPSNHDRLGARPGPQARAPAARVRAAAHRGFAGESAASVAGECCGHRSSDGPCGECRFHRRRARWRLVGRC